MLLVFLAIIQFVKPPKNNNPAVNEHDLTRHYLMPDSVRLVLQRACFDCHSNNTTYPAYSQVQPIGWWLNDHIKKGKGHLNFSEFETYTKKRQVKKLKEIATTVEKGEMPLNSYLWIHKDAVLTVTEKKMIEDWANNLSQQIAVAAGLSAEK